MSEIEQSFLERAIELSRKGMQEGYGGPFGCVIVKDGKIIGELLYAMPAKILMLFNWPAVMCIPVVNLALCVWEPYTGPVQTGWFMQTLSPMRRR